jgi:peptidyl-prolyl cis-trans isomerase D
MASRKSQAEQQAQRPLTIEELAAQGMDRAVLNDLAARESLSEWLHRAGIRPSDKQIAAELRKSTALFDPVTGKFDQAVYQQRLAENGLTPERYESLLRDEIATNHFVAGLGGGFRAPRIYTALAAAYALEGRDISYITVTPQMVGAVPPPTDAELTAFMNENKAQLMRPEFRVLSVVRFSPSVTATAPVDPAKVQERFDFRKDSLSTPGNPFAVPSSRSRPKRAPPSPSACARARIPRWSPSRSARTPWSSPTSRRPPCPTARSPTPPSP